MEIIYVLEALAIAVAIYFFGRLVQMQALLQPVLRLLPSRWQEVCLIYLWKAGAKHRDEILLAQVLCGIVVSVLLMLLLPSPFNWIPLLIVVLAITLFFQKMGQRREQATVELINLAGTLSLAVSGGQEFSVALSFYVNNEKGLLVEECRASLSRLRLGQHRETVFDDVVERFPVTREFFSAVRMSEKQGTPLAQVLKDQALRWRRHRLHKAESKAQRLPVLLMGPLALCIFPAVFLALLGPYLIDLI